MPSSAQRSLPAARDFFTLADVVRRWRISEAEVKRMVPVTKLGSLKRYSRQTVLKIEAAHTIGAQPESQAPTFELKSFSDMCLRTATTEKP
ncbi:MAG TPA: hypothetical protein VNT99_08405 [Methylomirabilota bacterium]|nr:hypothetical protein [Methylomirabilota bacterium]